MLFALLLPDDVPGWMTGMPGMFYAVLGFTGPVIERFAPRPAQA